MPKPDPNRFSRGLAIVLLSGSWSVNAMADRVSRSLETEIPPSELEGLCLRVLAVFPRPPELAILTEFLQQECSDKMEELTEGESPLERYPNTLAAGSPCMMTHPGISLATPLPELVTSGQLADWLGLEMGQLEWFADCRGDESKRSRESLRHYRYRWLAKRSGSARLIEMPKRRLREIQRQILRNILDHVPLHEAAHGFCKGRSVVTHAEPHCGQRVLLRIDLGDFFPSIQRRRVHALFRTIGYPEPVARLLTGLCTNTVPTSIIEQSHSNEANALIRRYGVPHLPQGAPTSPAIANLSAYRLDCRLNGLAHAFGATYTRYADDLAFSGSRGFQRRLGRFRQAVLAIVLCEGFEIRHRKTHVASRSKRQQIGGVVVNSHPNLPRNEYDQLKAIINNCIRYGPASQNRDGHPDFRPHLLGRIGHFTMIHAQRGRKLRQAFDQIAW